MSLVHRILLAVAALAATAATAAETPLPSGWTEVTPGGATLCARGEPFSFFYLPGDPRKVVIDFQGGGACWDAATCDTAAPTFIDDIDDLRRQIASGDLHGVYDAKNPARPYAGWTHVLVPYCTADVHWGAADVTYTRADRTSFVIHHRGAVNVTAALAWVKARYLAPAAVFVTGCSAGAYGSIFWTPAVIEAFPGAAVRQFGDSGVGVLMPAWQSATFPLWRVAAAAPRWVPGLDPTQVDYTKLSVSELYERVAAHYKEARFAQFNNAFDGDQIFFYVKMGGAASAWSPGMLDAIRQVHATTPNFSSFIGPGTDHCETPEDTYYSVADGDVRLSDWLGAYVRGTDVGDASCAPACGNLAPPP